MRRGCDRPGCVRSATAGFVFEGAAQLVRLVIVDDDESYAGLLCARHASTFTAPLGWDVRDERPTEVGPARRVATEPPGAANAPTTPTTPSASETALTRPVVDQPTLGLEMHDDGPAHEHGSGDVGGEPEADDPERDAMHDPEGDAMHEPEERGTQDSTSFEQLLDAETPLLSRAFRAAHPR